MEFLSATGLVFGDEIRQRLGELEFARRRRFRFACAMRTLVRWQGVEDGFKTGGEIGIPLRFLGHQLRKLREEVQDGFLVSHRVRSSWVKLTREGRASPYFPRRVRRSADTSAPRATSTV